MKGKGWTARLFKHCCQVWVVSENYLLFIVSIFLSTLHITITFKRRKRGDSAVAKQAVERSGSTGEAWGQLEKQSLLLLCLPLWTEQRCSVWWAGICSSAALCSVVVRVIPGTLTAPHTVALSEPSWPAALSLFQMVLPHCVLTPWAAEKRSSQRLWGSMYMAVAASRCLSLTWLMGSRAHRAMEKRRKDGDGQPPNSSGLNQTLY